MVRVTYQHSATVSRDHPHVLPRMRAVRLVNVHKADEVNPSAAEPSHVRPRLFTSYHCACLALNLR